MIQNLKVDIIYHLTPSDFEMEFNLCGCCRMRLLNDKTTDKKTFIKALARAVSRSRVIIACGPLFGGEGLIKTVATAIGSSTVMCDNATYGIASEEQIEIINGSTPLVTPDGYFGGCIIESGPQTIILLTENRGFRKTIMQNLIHPYVEEISYIPTKSAVPEPETQETAAVSDSEEYITEPDLDYVEEDVADNTYEAPQDEHNIDFIMDGETEEPSEKMEEVLPEIPPVDDISLNMYTEIESEDEKRERYEYGYTSSESDDMFISESEYDQRKKSKNQFKALDISLVILVLILLLAVLSLVYFVFLKPYTMGISTSDYLKQIFNSSGNNTLL